MRSRILFHILEDHISFLVSYFIPLEHDLFLIIFIQSAYKFEYGSDRALASFPYFYSSASREI